MGDSQPTRKPDGFGAGIELHWWVRSHAGLGRLHGSDRGRVFAPHDPLPSLGPPEETMHLVQPLLVNWGYTCSTTILMRR